MNERANTIRALRKRRPRDRFVRASLWIVAALVALAWLHDTLPRPLHIPAVDDAGSFTLGDFLSPQRRENVGRFLESAVPWPLQRGEGAGAVITWARDLLTNTAFPATAATFWMAVAAIVLAGITASLLTPLAARNLATPDPFLAGGRPPGPLRRWCWCGLTESARIAMILARAVPEYIWAFLFIATLGQGAWPAVLALALHNTGILGRLGAEVVENVERRPPGALRGLGAGRLKIHLFGILPVVLPRFLVFFFYRWETCVREATVLGMLGVLSLGYLIRDARARDHYDEMLVFILLGAILVLAVDAVSALLRSWLRKAA
jgi:phosphonate transport system permease protein